ncbi:MAG: preprotein translocase subunit SecY [Firmicutes bacterium]|nr:preprotein translocase subunit SecY [Bacillota bacterium]
MFEMIKQIFKPKNKDIQKRILFTLACLFVFVLGKAIVVPGVDKYSLGITQLGLLELVNVMGGGALEQFSIFALGVMPYITASIIIQILAMDIIPYLSELKKQGGTGRNQLNKITRITGIALAFVQGYVYSFAYLGKGAGILNVDYLQFALVLTAGTCLLLWIGDQISAKGIGNGVSLIIMAGIISSMPSMFQTAFTQLTSNNTIMGTVFFILFVIVYIAIILGVVYVEGAERRISVQYANKSNSSYGGRQNYMPFKLNSAGVMPVIFASTLLSIPSFIANVAKKDAFTKFVETYLSTTTVVGFIIYIVLIFVFAYFYTFMQMKPSEMSENLAKNGGFIPGVKPGDDTTEYISKVLGRITVVGALFLSILAGLPIIFGLISKLPSSVTLGGTSLLIVVGVALETFKQLESQLQSRSYRRR